MTPATQETIPAEFSPRRPTGLHVTDARVSWTGERRYADDEWPGTDSLLQRFVDLAHAQPEEMADWLERYGVLELCGHGHPEGACVFKTCAGMLDEGRALDVRSLRDAARTFGSALDIASQLRQRKPGDRRDWVELQNLLGGGSLPPVQDPDDRDDYALARQRFADWLERCFNSCGIGHEIRWRSRVGVQSSPMARDLLGVLVILLYREAVGNELLHCDHCGNAVDRSRRPRRGEGVFCSESDCQRARVRANQRRSRAERKA